MKAPCLTFALILAACSANTSTPSGLDAAGGGNPDGNTGDPMADASTDIDAPASSMITISGVTSERDFNGTSAVGGVAIAAYRTTDEATPVASTQSDGQGNYSLAIATNGAAFDGYIKAAKTGYVDIYFYPPRPFAADFNDGDINMLTPSNKNFLNQLANGGQQAGKGMIGLAVLDASGQPVAGARVSSMPASGASRYTGSDGFPSSSATETSADGVAFLFNVPTNVTITATKAGMTFHAHALKARPDQFTVTAIMP